MRFSQAKYGGSNDIMEQLHVLARGLLRRCPSCGQPHIFRQWLRMSDRCPRCGLHFEREEGYWTGAVAINTVVTELVFITMLATVVVWTWPNVPMIPVLVVAVGLNGGFPLLFYPISKTLWVAIDLVLHPLEEREQFEVVSLREARKRINIDQDNVS